jgi:hypothetical protein
MRRVLTIATLVCCAMRATAESPSTHSPTSCGYIDFGRYLPAHIRNARDLPSPIAPNVASHLKARLGPTVAGRLSVSGGQLIDAVKFRKADPSVAGRWAELPAYVVLFRLYLGIDAALSVRCGCVKWGPGRSSSRAALRVELNRCAVRILERLAPESKDMLATVSALRCRCRRRADAPEAHAIRLSLSESQPCSHPGTDTDPPTKRPVAVSPQPVGSRYSFRSPRLVTSV